MIKTRLIMALAALSVTACQAKSDDATVNQVPSTAEAPAPVATQGAYTIDRTHRTGTRLLREILLDGGMLESGRITDFRLDDRCKTSILTATGSTTVDWTKVQNILSRTIAGRRTFTIEQDGQPIKLSIPEKGDTPKGNAAEQLESGFNVLAGDCQS